MGTRKLLQIVAHDNEGRFLLAGSMRKDDRRGEYVDTGMWSTWICASQRHNKKIAAFVDDSDIATVSYTSDSRSGIQLSISRHPCPHSW